MAAYTVFAGAYGHDFSKIVGLVRFSKYPFHVYRLASDSEFGFSD